MFYGWVEDKIWSLAKSNWQIFTELPWCLVTCIDSSPNVTFMMKAEGIHKWEGFCSFLGKGLIVSDGKILNVAKEYNLFNGFDEIWLFRNCPTVEKPDEVSIVPPPPDLSRDAPPKELLEWFNASGCIVGLGDGVGMNYMTTSREIVESLNTRQREFESGIRQRGYTIYSSGWLQDSICSLIQSRWEVFDELPYALVTCINGSHDLKSMIAVRKMVESEDSCSFLGGSLLVGDGRLLAVAQKYSLLSHFDEIWFYEERPALDKPSEFWIISPLNLSKDVPPEGLLEWFNASRCILGLGGGMGVNYVASASYAVGRKFQEFLGQNR
jgi:hypothetical protein